jgi:predicted nucleic acid-binding Zn ribbon protein
VYEGADVCPACGNYLSREDAPRRARRYPLWVIIGAIICLAIVLLMWTR